MELFSSFSPKRSGDQSRALPVDLWAMGIDQDEKRYNPNATPLREMLNFVNTLPFRNVVIRHSHYNRSASPLTGCKHEPPSGNSPSKPGTARAVTRHRFRLTENAAMPPAFPPGLKTRPKVGSRHPG
jgi:hypothetical protein